MLKKDAYGCRGFLHPLSRSSSLLLVSKYTMILSSLVIISKYAFLIRPGIVGYALLRLAVLANKLYVLNLATTCVYKLHGEPFLLA